MNLGVIYTEDTVGRTLYQIRNRSIQPGAAFVFLNVHVSGTAFARYRLTNKSYSSP